MIGLLACLLLAAIWPVTSVLAGLALFAVGLAGRALALRLRRTTAS